jgi:hypothetical protein
MKEERELSHYVYMYKNKWTKRYFEKCFAHGRERHCSRPPRLLGDQSAPGERRNLGITNKAAKEEPR